MIFYLFVIPQENPDKEAAHMSDAPLSHTVGGAFINPSSLSRRVKVIRRLLMLFMFSSTFTFAARPYHTDDAGTTELGKFEVETAVDYGQHSFAPGLVFKRGLTERMELDIPVGYVLRPEDERGIAHLQLYAKFALIPDLFAVTFTSAFAEPDYAVNGIIGKAFGDFNTNLNLGGSMVGNTNDADMTYGISETYTTGKIETGAEIGGTQEGLDWWQIGIKFFFKKWCSIDAGIGGDFEKKMNMNVTTGLVFAFPVTTEKKGE
jgi:hypothetical protein